MLANVQNQRQNNQTDREINGAWEYHIDMTAIKSKDQNTKGEDMSIDLSGRQPFAPPGFPDPLYPLSHLINEQAHGYILTSKKRMSKEI